MKKRLIPAIPIIAAFAIAPLPARADDQLMIAVARIFDGRYALKFDTRYRIGPDLNLQMTGPDSATVSGTELSFWRAADSKCTFRMGARNAIEAQIDFARLSDEYSFGRRGELTVYGAGAAVCDHTVAPGKLTCFQDYRATTVSATPQIVRAFRLVFAKACAPLQLPIN